MEVSSLGRACGPRSALQVVFGAIQCSLVAGFCRDVSGDGAWPPRVVFPASEFLPDGCSVVWVFSIMFVYSSVYFHSLSMEYPNVTGLFVGLFS